MFYLHIKLRAKSQSDMYFGTEGVVFTVSRQIIRFKINYIFWINL